MGTPPGPGLSAPGNQGTQLKSIWPKCFHRRFLPWSNWRIGGSLESILRPIVRAPCDQQGGNTGTHCSTRGQPLGQRWLPYQAIPRARLWLWSTLIRYNTFLFSLRCAQLDYPVCIQGANKIQTSMPAQLAPGLGPCSGPRILKLGFYS